MRALLLLLAVSMPALAVGPFEVVYTDRALSGVSQYPVAVTPEKVGTYPGETKSGAGYFYDEVLEYRVWMSPKTGAAPLANGSAYFAAFAQYEAALVYSRATPGAEEPLVLVLQRESINEPTPGHYVVDKKQRITEWQVKWLRGSKRTATSIEEFLAHPKAATP
jgi:hypothetical protein